MKFQLGVAFIIIAIMFSCGSNSNESLTKDIHIIKEENKETTLKGVIFIDDQSKDSLVYLSQCTINEAYLDPALCRSKDKLYKSTQGIDAETFLKFVSEILGFKYVSKSKIDLLAELDQKHDKMGALQKKIEENKSKLSNLDEAILIKERLILTMETSTEDLSSLIAVEKSNLQHLKNDYEAVSFLIETDVNSTSDLHDLIETLELMIPHAEKLAEIRAGLQLSQIVENTDGTSQLSNVFYILEENGLLEKVAGLFMIPNMCSGHEILDGRCFEAFFGELSWNKAQASCEKLGGNLASITNSKINDHVVNLHQGNETWLGAYRKGNNWRWINGKYSFSYSNWHPHEPNNLGGNENCVVMYTDSRENWNDEQCSRPRAYTCEFAAH